MRSADSTPPHVPVAELADRHVGYDHRALRDVVGRANGHRGQRALAEAIAQEPAFTRSELEAWFLLVRQAALPRPQANFPLTALDHQPIEVDFCWPTHRLIVELDGCETHRPEPPSRTTGAGMRG